MRRRHRLGGQDVLRFLRDFARTNRQPPRKPKGKGGSEPVTVEPNRPKMGEGGAAAALEFDE